MTPTGPIVYVVDDDDSVRAAVVRGVKQLGYGCEEFGTAEAFLERAHRDRTSCLLLDVHLDHGTGFDLHAELERRGDELPTIFMTGDGDIPMSVRAMKQGAVEFLTKPLDWTAVATAIAQALERSSRAQARRAEVAGVRARLDRLTPRERAVLPGVARGLLNKQIAMELGIVEQTVKVHRARVMQKLEVASLADLVRFVERAAGLGIAV